MNKFSCIINNNIYNINKIKIKNITIIYEK